MKKQTRQRKPLPPEIIELMGKPPILSTEDEEVYYGIMERLSEDLATSDMIGWMLVQDVVDARIEIGRCRRFKAAVVEHGFRLRCRDLVENTKEAGKTAVKQLRAVADAELRKATTESFNDEKCLTKKKSEIEARFDRDCAEKRQIFDSLEEAWQRRRADEQELAIVWPYWIFDHEVLDQILEKTEKRFFDTLRQLERHTLGFAKSLREELRIIEGEVLRKTGSETEVASG